MGSINDVRHGLIFPVSSTELNTPDTTTAFDYCVNGGRLDHVRPADKFMLATRVSIAMYNPVFVRELLMRVNRRDPLVAVRYRKMQFYSDVYGHALDGVTEHDLSIWETLLSANGDVTVSTDTYETLRKKLVNQLTQVQSMSVDRFVQTWLSRDDGFEYLLGLVRLTTD